MRNQLEPLILCGSNNSDQSSKIKQLAVTHPAITEVNTTPRKHCAIKQPYTLKTSGLHLGNDTTGLKGRSANNIK